MLKVGDNVKIICEILDGEGLLPELNTTGKDYMSYVWNNEDKIYTIKEIDNRYSDPYILDDELLCETSFNEYELEKVII